MSAFEWFEVLKKSSFTDFRYGGAASIGKASVRVIVGCSDGNI
jgi:hypothetical protein